MTPISTFAETPARRQKIQKLLLSAIYSGHLLRVKKLLSQGADPSLPYGRLMFTPLMAAASRAHTELIALFLPFNDIAATDACGRTPLFLFMESLLTYCAPASPPNWREALSSLLTRETATKKTNNGLSPLLFAAHRMSNGTVEFNDIVEAFRPFADFSATDANGLTATALALEAVSSPSRALLLFREDAHQELCLSLPNHAGGSLAHVAARQGQLDFLAEILPRLDLNAIDARGRTPLMASAAKRLFPSIDFLLAQGADPLCVDHDGCDALMLAIERHQLSDSARLDFCNGLWRKLLPLAQKSNLLSRDHLGESAFDKAMDRDLFELAEAIEMLAGPEIRYLPAMEAGPPRATPIKLSELLCSAIYAGRLDLVDKRLLQGADPQVPHPYSATPLMAACSLKMHHIIRRLSPISNLLAEDSHGNTALFYFLAGNLIDTPERLFIMTELLSPENASHLNFNGLSPLSVLRPSPEFFSATTDLLGLRDYSKAIMAGGSIDFNFNDETSVLHALAIFEARPEGLLSVLNHKGHSVFHLAAKHGATAFLAATASHAALAALDFLGQTPLMRACDALSNRGNTHQTVALLAPWSDCQVVDACGCDALMLAIEAAHRESDDLFETVQSLALGSNLEARDFLGESALDKALARGFERSSNILQACLAIEEERDALASAAIARPSSPPARSSTRI